MKMYHSETNTFCYVWKSKIIITDSYEFIRHMHECQFKGDANPDDYYALYEIS